MWRIRAVDGGFHELDRGDANGSAGEPGRAASAPTAITPASLTEPVGRPNCPISNDRHCRGPLVGPTKRNGGCRAVNAAVPIDQQRIPGRRGHPAQVHV